MTFFNSPLGRLRLVALAEGVSYVLLLGIAMPLKYLYDKPEFVRVVGMAHGVLFVLLIVALLHAHLRHKWGLFFSSLVFLSSLVPLGAFWMERRLKGLAKGDGPEDAADFIS